jgi:hypothetical protein
MYNQGRKKQLGLSSTQPPVQCLQESPDVTIAQFNKLTIDLQSPKQVWSIKLYVEWGGLSLRTEEGDGKLRQGIGAYYNLKSVLLVTRPASLKYPLLPKYRLGDLTPQHACNQLRQETRVLEINTQ